MLRISPFSAVSSAVLCVLTITAACSSSSDTPPADGSGGDDGSAGERSSAGKGGEVAAAGRADSAAGGEDSPGGSAGGAGGASEPVSEAGAAGGPAQGSVRAGPLLEMGSAVCGIAKGGAAYCWGFGQNGETGAEVGSSLVPVPVQGGLTFTSISTYGGHTCALTAAGAAYCWGDGSFNALGDGSTNGHLSKKPVPVTGNLKFAAISVGNNYTCALTADGTAYAWGDNRKGQLGLGVADDTARTTPSKIPNLKFQSISARDDSVCAITTGGEAYCWGANAGVNGTGGPLEATVATPTAVPGGVSLQSVVVASADHACGLTDDGHAYCWGNGTLGDGMAGGAPALGETAVAGEHLFTQLAASRNAFCGVTAEGETYCWGPPFANSPTLGFAGIVAAEVATRGVATCVVSTAGTASCLGSNALGELGDGTNMAHAEAKPVSGNIEFLVP